MKPSTFEHSTREPSIFHRDGWRGAVATGRGKDHCHTFKSSFGMLIWMGFIGTLFIAPLCMGGRESIGQLAYFESVCILGLIAFFMAGTTRLDLQVPRGALLLLVAGGALLIIQQIPLSEMAFRAISPHRPSLLPMWQAHETTGAIQATFWETISLTPMATRRAMYVYAAHVGLFLVTLQIVKDVNDVERLLRLVAMAASSMAVFGLIQYVSGTEEFAWVFAHPSRQANAWVCGPFSNPNHFASYIMLGVAPLLWCLQASLARNGKKSVRTAPLRNLVRNQRLKQLLLSSFLVAIVGLAGALTFSRGGVLVISLASLLALLGFWRVGLLTHKIGLALGAAAILLSLTLLIHGVDRLSNELESLASGSIDTLDPSNYRRRLWLANLTVWQYFPIFGTGVGSHAEVYRIGFSDPVNVEFTHAESSLLQVLTETGIVGFGLLLTGICMSVRWCVNVISVGVPVRVRACGVAMLSSILTGTVHAVFDFAWHLTSCMSVLIILVACSCRLNQFTQDSEGDSGPRRWSFRPIQLGTVIAVVCFFVAGTVTLARSAAATWHWHDYKHLSLMAEREAKRRENLHASGELSEYAVASSSHREREEMTERLERVLDVEPSHPRANLRMAAILLKQFEVLQQTSDNAMSLSDIRSAALASNFSSRADQDKWLTAAIGSSRALLDSAFTHVIRSLRGCPLQGRGYVYWADLAFLHGWHDEAQTQLFSQALAVRPYDAMVLFAAGQFAVQHRSPQIAVEFWKRAFHQATDYRDAIIRSLANQFPPEAFVQLFQPDEDGMQRLFEEYRRLRQPEHAKAILPRIVAILEQRASEGNRRRSAELWRRAGAMYQFTGDLAGAIACGRRAVADQPMDFMLRKWLALQLVNAKRYEESLPELAWCLRRQPDDSQLVNHLRMAQSRRFDTR